MLFVACPFAEERMWDEMEEDIAQEPSGRKGDHRVEGGRLEGSRYREQDEVGDAAVSLAGMRPTHEEM